MRMVRLCLLIIAAGGALSLGACASREPWEEPKPRKSIQLGEKVQPWERGNLSKDVMIGRGKLKLAFESHMAFSKEANSGGDKAGGGGCGCN